MERRTREGTDRTREDTGRRTQKEDAPATGTSKEAPARAKRAGGGEKVPEPRREHRSRAPDTEDPDVLLEVPDLRVDEIELEVENLRASLSLQAEVLDLLGLKVGADVELGRVALTIKGVEAQAELKVRLDNVREMIARVLQTVDANPQILEHVTRGVESSLDQVAGGVGRAAGALGRGVGDAVEDIGGGSEEAAEDSDDGKP